MPFDSKPPLLAPDEQTSPQASILFIVVKQLAYSLIIAHYIFSLTRRVGGFGAAESDPQPDRI